MWKVVLLGAVVGCSRPEDRIVGGRDAAKGEFPWMASLQRLTWRGFFHVCGAALFEPEWLVTAAHCIQLENVNAYRIVIGHNNLSSIPYQQQLKVKRIVVKQGFDKSTFHNDIALLQLTHPLMVLTLGLANLQKKGTARIAGWGAKQEGGIASPILQTAQVEIIGKERCCSLYYGRAITSSMVCAGYDAGGIDACQGDSGGPLFFWHQERAYLAAIVSWGEGCADPQSPGVYTDVSHLLSWIQHYTGTNYSFTGT